MNADHADSTVAMVKHYVGITGECGGPREAGGGGGGGAAARRAHVWPARASAATLLHCTCIACPHELAVDKATILNLDRLGMNVACERQGQSFKARLPFPRPAADRKSIKVCSGRGARHAAAPPPLPPPSSACHHARRS